MFIKKIVSKNRTNEATRRPHDASRPDATTHTTCSGAADRRSHQTDLRIVRKRSSHGRRTFCPRSLHPGCHKKPPVRGCRPGVETRLTFALPRPLAAAREEKHGGGGGRGRARVPPRRSREQRGRSGVESISFQKPCIDRSATGELPRIVR